MKKWKEWIIHNYFTSSSMEPVSILSLIMTCVLVIERLWKYTISHIKKSKCCGSEVEFDHTHDSQNDLNV